MIKKILFWVRHLFSYIQELNDLERKTQELQQELLRLSMEKKKKDNFIERLLQENKSLRASLDECQRPRKPYKKRVTKSTAADSQNESGQS